MRHYRWRGKQPRLQKSEPWGSTPQRKSILRRVCHESLPRMVVPLERCSQCIIAEHEATHTEASTEMDERMDRSMADWLELADLDTSKGGMDCVLRQ